MLFLHFGMGMLTLGHCTLERHNFLIFTECHSYEFGLCLRNWRLGLVSNIGIVKTLAILRINAFCI